MGEPDDRSGPGPRRGNRCREERRRRGRRRRARAGTRCRAVGPGRLRAGEGAAPGNPSAPDPRSVGAAAPKVGGGPVRRVSCRLVDTRGHDLFARSCPRCGLRRWNHRGHCPRVGVVPGATHAGFRDVAVSKALSLTGRGASSECERRPPRVGGPCVGRGERGRRPAGAQSEDGGGTGAAWGIAVLDRRPT